MELGREKKVSHWVIYRFLVPNNPSPSSFLADAWANRDLGLTFPTCLLRRALSFAVQGLIMLSEGEMYCLVWASSILDCRTWRWYSMLLIEDFELDSCEVIVALTSFADSTFVDILAIARMRSGGSFGMMKVCS